MISSHGRFVWYELLTTDVAAATAFYTRVMGWGAWDASTPGRPYILFGDGKSAISALTPLAGRCAADGRAAGLGRLRRGRRRRRRHRAGRATRRSGTGAADRRRGYQPLFGLHRSAGHRLALFKWRNPDQQPPAAPDAAGRVGWHELFAADGEQAWAFYGELFGWQKEDADISEAATYQPFSAGEQMIGAMFTKPAAIPASFWLYYFNTDDIDTAAQRVTAGGGEVLEGPFETAGGSWVIRCADPQGAAFALEGTRKSRPVGYFESAARPDASGARGRWSW